MSAPMERPQRRRHTGSQRQLGTRPRTKEGGGALTDLFSEHKMKIQTNLKAGGGLLDIDIDVDIDVDVSLFGGCKKKSGHSGC